MNKREEIMNKREEIMNKKENTFKARCIRTNDKALTVDKVYSIVDGYGHWDAVSFHRRNPKFDYFPCYDDGNKTKVGFLNFKEMKDWFGKDTEFELVE